MSANNIKAILFDMDGVLVEAKEWHYNALNDALTHYSFEPISIYDHETIYDGLSTSKKLKMLAEQGKFDISFSNKVSDLKQQYTHQIFQHKCTATVEQTSMFVRLKELGYKMCICSNSIKQTVLMCVTKMDLAQYIEFFLSNEDVSDPKPSPEIYNKAIQMLNLKPTECIIIEDNFNGIKAARASGAHVMEVAYTTDVNISNYY